MLNRFLYLVSLLAGSAALIVSYLVGDSVMTYGHESAWANASPLLIILLAALGGLMTFTSTFFLVAYGE